MYPTFAEATLIDGPGSAGKNLAVVPVPPTVTGVLPFKSKFDTVCMLFSFVFSTGMKLAFAVVQSVDSYSESTIVPSVLHSQAPMAPRISKELFV
jgi:hypothetical protein